MRFSTALLAPFLALVAGCRRASEIEEPCAEAVVVTVVEVIDGDTIDVDPPVTLPDGEVTRFRLLCINTPETYGTSECWGEEAKDYAIERLEGEQVQLVFDRDCIDMYGRGLAYVKTRPLVGSGKLFNLEMVREGYAVMIDDYFTDYTWCPEIAEAAAEAMEAGTGGWGECSADPWVEENAE